MASQQIEVGQIGNQQWANKRCAKHSSVYRKTDGKDGWQHRHRWLMPGATHRGASSDVGINDAARVGSRPLEQLPLVASSVVASGNPAISPGSLARITPLKD